MGELDRLFAPERVAVVGASEKEGSVGRAVMANLVDSFEGTVLPVNPNRDEVLGLQCHSALASLSDVDVVVVVVPSPDAVSVVREAAEAGIKNVVVITAGFGEAGSEGAAREQELIDVATEHDLNLVGPNSLGIMSAATGLNASFAPASPTPGPLAFMSQSGAFITAVLDWAADRHVGFTDVVSLGNKAVLDESDFVREWGDDPETNVILGYLEDVGDGQEFMAAAREVTRDTPIVVVKSGRTEEGASAAASHTGAMAGSDRAYEAALDQCGVLRAESVEELFDVGAMLATQPVPDGDGVAIVTNAGGPGVMTTDAVGDSSLALANFADDTLEVLRESLPDGANVYNPVDIIGDAAAERFERTLEIVASDDAVDMLVVLACPTATLSFDELATVTTAVQERSDLPTAATLMGGSRTDSARVTLQEAGIPTFFDPARAVRGLDALGEYGRRRDREVPEPTTFDVDATTAGDRLTAAAERGRTRLGVESMGLLADYGISTPAGAVVDDPAEAERIAAEIGDDVVMKIVSPDISHKSDIGGVEIGVAQADVRDTYEDLVVRARNYQPDAAIQGVQVQELIDVEAGTEVIVGMSRDPQFGPLLMVGLGGIFVEVLEDTAFRVAPVAESEVRDMLAELRSEPLLRGARGREPADVDALVEVIQRVSQLVTDYPAITELDINPVVALPEGAAAIDLRLTLDTEEL